MWNPSHRGEVIFICSVSLAGKSGGIIKEKTEDGSPDYTQESQDQVPSNPRERSGVVRSTTYTLYLSG